MQLTEIGIKIFDFCRPTGVYRVFEAAADRPADVRFVHTKIAACVFGIILSPCDATRRIHEGAIERVAQAHERSAEEIDLGARGSGHGWQTILDIAARNLDLAAEEPIRRNHRIVTRLHTAKAAGRLQRYKVHG